MTEITTVPAQSIVAGNNDRVKFDPVKLRELADSIAKDGLAQAPLLRRLGDKYQIICGERRVRAMRDLLGWDAIPCRVIECSDETASALMLAENTARVDLDPIEEARSYRARMDAFGYTPERVAAIAGVKVAHVRQYVTLLTLVPEAQTFIASGQFALRYAFPLAAANLDTNRQRIAMRLCRPDLRMEHWREILKRLSVEQDQEALPGLEDFLRVQIVTPAETEDAVITGKRARTGIPAGTSVPPVRYRREDRMAHIAERYIADLRAAGQHAAAEAVGNLYNCYVALARIDLVPDLEFPRQSDARAGDGAMLKLD